MRPLFAEFVGTFFIVFTVGCNHIEADPEWIPLSTALALIAALYAVGEVSGGHLNPAVSLAVALAGKRPFRDMLLYCVVQFVASMVAALLLWNTFGFANLGAGDAGDGFSIWSASFVEITYSMMICLVMLNVRTSKRNNPVDDGNQFWALAIGMVVLAVGYSGAGISGACINPAVTLAMVHGSSVPMYLVVQFFGAFLAATLFRMLRPEDFQDAADVWTPDVVSPDTPCRRVKIGSEFLGTFLLVFTMVLALLDDAAAKAAAISPSSTPTPSRASPAPTLTQGTQGDMPIAAAACWVSLVYALWDVSGAHLNPAVTLAVVCCGRGKCPPRDGLFYVVAQLIAGVGGTLVAMAIYNFPLIVLVNPALGWIGVVICEAIFTALVALAVLSAATVESFPPPVSSSKFEIGLAIGLSVAVGGFVSAKLSGGLLNPAVSLGLAFGNNLSATHLLNCLWYFLAQLAGGLIGSLTFVVTHRKSFKQSA